jgi:putative tryptophan/tyrosine transport system substrate-binding protein
MRRREFIAGLATVAAGSISSQAEQHKLVLGYLVLSAAKDAIDRFPAFLDGLNEIIDSRQLTIVRPEFTNPDQRSALAAALVSENPSAIYAGDLGTAIALKRATSTIPIVFTSADDPISNGLVSSMSRPGGNVTGNRLRAGEEPTKLLEVLHELVPTRTALGMLINPAADMGAERDGKSVEEAARPLMLNIFIERVNEESDISGAFANFAQARVGGVIVNETRYLAVRRSEVAGLAMRYSIPAIGGSREFAHAGGLASYGSDINDGFRQAGVYVGRILKGEIPANLPILQPIKFDLVLNLKTATTLGVTIPPTILARADEVIE